MVHGARHLGDVLLDMGVLKQGALQAALAEQRRTGIRLGELLVERKAINTEQLSQALAEQQGLEWVSRADLQPEAEALAAVDASTARAFGALPLSLKGGVLRIAVSDT
ncbi:MAG: ATPase, partial [Planctomycetes bacterium]|nr:ATPase [Planctomycetota bacterium]